MSNETIERNADWCLAALSDGKSIRRRAWPAGKYLGMHGNFPKMKRCPPGQPARFDGFGEPTGLVQELILLTRYACIWRTLESQGESWQPNIIAHDLSFNDWEIVA